MLACPELYTIYSVAGGLVFILVWVLFLILWSSPMLLIEYGIGRYTRRALIGTSREFLGEKFAWCGAWMVMVSFFISWVFTSINNEYNCFIVLHLISVYLLYVLCRDWTHLCFHLWPNIYLTNSTSGRLCDIYCLKIYTQPSHKTQILRGNHM